MISSDYFGSIVVPRDIESAAAETVAHWMPFYLRELERQKGIPENSLPAIRSYRFSRDFGDAQWPEDQLPCIIFVTPGMVGLPRKDGSGSYRTTWALGVATVVSGRDEASTRQLTGLYTGAVRA